VSKYNIRNMYIPNYIGNGVGSEWFSDHVVLADRVSGVRRKGKGGRSCITSVISKYKQYNTKQTNSVVLVRTRTIPTERPPPVGEVSANFCG